MHSEYIRLVDGADVAVLFIHGIIGTPRHFDDLIPLVPKNISIYNMLLDGHGKGVSDFSHTSMKKWEAQASRAVDSLLSTHKKLFIVAHSMGTLLAIEQATRRAEISGLFLLAVPIKLFIKPRMLINVTKVFFDKVSPDDPYASAAKRCYGIGKDKNIFKYIGWIPRYLELFAKIRRTRKILCMLKAPTEIYQSLNDEMVSRGSIKMLESVPSANLTVLERSSHYYYEENDAEILKKGFARLTEKAISDISC